MADSFGDCEVCLGSMVPAFHEKLGWREVNLKPYHQLWESDTSQRDCSLTQVGVVLSPFLGSHQFGPFPPSYVITSLVCLSPAFFLPVPLLIILFTPCFSSCLPQLPLIAIEYVYEAPDVQL